MSVISPLTYDVFVADPIAQNVTDRVPNGDRRMFSPLSVTLVHGARDAVLVDPPSPPPRPRPWGTGSRPPART